MPTLTIDFVLFGVFLALNLIVGLSYGRKVKDLKDYALGGKNFSTATLAATIIATWHGGGSLFYTLENTYSRGLYYIIAIVGLPLGLWLSGQLAVRMGEFLNNVSVAEAMGDMYGKTVQIITAISGIIAKIGYTAVQFKAISIMLSSLFNLESTGAALIAASIVIAYSTLGGVRAVTFTDVLQFFTFGVIIPILALAIWNSVKNHTQVAATLASNPLFSFKEVVGWTPQFMSTLGLLLYFAIPGVYSPEIFQRIAMARDIRQVKHSLTYAAGIFLLIFLLTAWVSILLLADHPGLSPEQVVPYMIKQHTYTGLRGLLGVGVMALAMSTADSCLNASSVMFANDIVNPLTGQTKGKVITARSFSLIIGTAALLIALYSSNLLSIVLLSGSFYMPIFTVPMLMAVLGFRSTTKAVLIGMTSGFMTVVLWSIFGNNADSIVPGMLANLIGLLGSHYLLREQGGWKKVDPNSLLAIERQERREAWQRRMKAIRRFKLNHYLQQSLPKRDRFYLLFGFYTLASSYASLYTLSDNIEEQYQSIYRAIQYSMLVMTTSFLLYPLWPHYLRSKRVLTWIWPLSIGYALFFVGGMLAIMNGAEQIQMMLLMLNIVMTVLLIRWPLALFLAGSGILAAVCFFKYYTGLDTLPTTLITLQFKVIYGLLLFSSFLIALFRYKQARDKLEYQNISLATTSKETSSELLGAFKDRKKFIRAFRESGATDLAGLAGLSNKISEKTKGLKLPQELKQDITQLREKLSSIALHLDRLDHRAAEYMRLETATITIDAFLQAAQERLRARELDKRINWKKMTQHKEVECDVARIESLLVNSVSFMRTVAGENVPILIGIEDTQLGYPMSAVEPGYTKKIDALRITLTTQKTLPAMEAIYLAQMSEDTTPMPETTTDLPLVANERILKAHYGYTNTIADGKALIQVYVIPKQLREVRPTDMDLPEMELGAKPTRSDDTYPGAKEQEEEFIKAVEGKTQADMSLVHKAIEVIKEYHGPVRRRSGEPFYLHPLSVAHIVLDYNQDESTVLGALLHDTVEDTPLTADQIAILFNKEVSGIVEGVTHLNSQKDTLYKVKLSPHENIRMLLGIEDARVLHVKIADRMHNMRTIQYKPYQNQRRTAEETLLFFVPLAEKLGLKQASLEFKKLCFKVLTEKQ